MARADKYPFEFVSKKQDRVNEKNLAFSFSANVVKGRSHSG
jgi:hypothetical protein